MSLLIFFGTFGESKDTKLRLMCVNVYGPVKREKRIMTHIDYSRDTSLARTYYIHQTGDTK